MSMRDEKTSIFLTREREDEYFFDEKAAIKREESGACSDYPEREQARPKVNYNLGDTLQIQSKTKTKNENK